LHCHSDRDRSIQAATLVELEHELQGPGRYIDKTQSKGRVSPMKRKYFFDTRRAITEGIVKRQVTTVHGSTVWYDEDALLENAKLNPTRLIVHVKSMKENDYWGEEEEEEVDEN
jgi:hypothetical protein